MAYPYEKIGPIKRDLFTYPKPDIVLANSAAALVSAGHAKTFPEGMAQAAESIDSGAALRKLEQLAGFTQSLG
ncbi:MAG: hypothetical protein ABSG25_01400 [Bryobacteraceae bacterium]